MTNSILDERIEIMLEKVMLEEKDELDTSNSSINDNKNKIINNKKKKKFSFSRKTTKSLTFNTNNSDLIDQELFKMHMDFDELKKKNSRNFLLNDSNDFCDHLTEENKIDENNENGVNIKDFTGFNPYNEDHVTSNLNDNNNIRVEPRNQKVRFKNIKLPLKGVFEGNVTRNNKKFNTVNMSSNKPDYNIFQVNSSIPSNNNVPNYGYNSNNFSNPYNQNINIKYNTPFLQQR